MKTIPIHDAKTNLSKYISAAKRGKIIYIGGYGKAEVQLTAVPNLDNSLNRNFSIGKSKIIVKQNAFSEKTDDLVEQLMFGN
jgi:antitoxin (DNA-binding transcriptional repressor) of toxin-antitoxin stability system